MSIELIIISFLAGILTVLTPCTFTLLPVILAGSVDRRDIRRPAVIIISLAISIILFTLILRASTALIHIPPDFWKVLSGSLLILVGISNLFPALWNKVSFYLGLSKSEEILEKSKEQNAIKGGILAGIALGPVFTSCSPTYLFILSTVLPREFTTGLIYLVIYTFGLSLILLLITIFGQKIINNFKWAVNPNGLLRKVLGMLFLIIGLLIILGIDKRIEATLLQSDFLNNLINFEWGLLKK